MKKYITVTIMALAVLLSQTFVFNTNTVEARSDYYIGYDAEEGCDAYIDVDSISKDMLMVADMQRPRCIGRMDIKDHTCV